MRINAILLLLPLLLSCSTEEDATRTLTYQVDGTVAQAAITWISGGSTQFDLEAQLPWVQEVKAHEGERAFISVSSGNTGAGLWIRVLENDTEVRVVPGCLCNGTTVSAQADGIVGAWN